MMVVIANKSFLLQVQGGCSPGSDGLLRWAPAYGLAMSFKHGKSDLANPAYGLAMSLGMANLMWRILRKGER